MKANKIAKPVTKAANVKMPIGNLRIKNKNPLQVAGSVKKNFILLAKDIGSEEGGSLVGREMFNKWIVWDFSNLMINQINENIKAKMRKPTQRISKGKPTEKPTTKKIK